MKKLLKALVALIYLIQLCSFAAPVFADNSQIPKSLFSWRDSLLDRRDALLKNKAITEGNIRIYKNSLNELDSQMPLLTPDSRAKAVGIRAEWMQRIAELEDYIRTIEIALINTDKAIAAAESDMNAWACLK